MQRQIAQKMSCVLDGRDIGSYVLPNADYKFYIEAGLEQAIAATKTYSATVVMLWLIALKAAQNKHIDIGNETKEAVAEIRKGTRLFQHPQLCG